MAVSRVCSRLQADLQKTLYFGDTAPSGDVWAALSMTEFEDLEIGATFVGDLTWTEYDGAGYARQQLVLSDVAYGMQWRLRAANTDFGEPDAGTNPAVAALLMMGTGDPGDDGAVNRPIGWMQGETMVVFPFTGDGAANLTIPWPNSTVQFGPNA